MVSLEFVVIVLMLPGCLFMLASFWKSIRLAGILPSMLRRKWSAMTLLILFFLIGYFAFLEALLRDFRFPLELLTGSVFLGGSIFVFMVMQLSSITISELLQSEERINEINQRLIEANKELVTAYDSTIEGWGYALELRDKETEGHTRRVTELTVRVARSYGLKEKEIVHIRRGALLHDIGKMGIPDSILLKKGPLTAEEEAIMHKHPVYAFQMLYPIAYLRPALEIPYSHHERWDGSGYPQGLTGKQIPLAARIFALADNWDALISERRYHEPWPREQVENYLRTHSGTYFDPELVEIYLSCITPAPAA